MSVFSLAFFTTLKGDATLIADLSSFNSRKSIFMYQPIPKDVEPPYIISTGEISDDSFDTKDTVGREIRRDIRCYDFAEGDAIRIERIAERVRTLFHRQSISFTGFKTIHIDVFGPIIADEEDLYGRILTVRCLLDAT